MSPQFHRRGKLRRLSVGLLPGCPGGGSGPAGLACAGRRPSRRPARPARPSSRCSRRRTCRAPQQGDRTRNLDFLFGALKAAPDADSAKQVEARIWALWTASGSDTANLLMTRAKTAIEASDLDLAIELLNSIVKIKPDYVEAWNRRATHALHAQGIRRRRSMTSARC